MYGRGSSPRARRGLALLLAGGLLVTLELAVATGGFAALGGSPGSVRSGLVTVGPERLALTIRVAPSTGIDQLTPANFTVPANVPVVVTITNYDPGVNPSDPAWDQVLGTLSGTESTSFGNSLAVGSTVWVPASQVSHILTIGPFGGALASTAGAGPLRGGPPGVLARPGDLHPDPTSVGVLVNLPIPAAHNATVPAVVSATLLLRAPGTYSWWCSARCDPDPMATVGFMRGTVLVEAAP